MKSSFLEKDIEEQVTWFEEVSEQEFDDDILELVVQTLFL